MEFKSFNEIVRLNSSVCITEKINGTNAQVLIEEFPSTPTSPCGWIVKAGSRNRWISPDDDNYGFARWVEANGAALIKALGPGRHFGEWYGSGIDSGYGLPKGEKRFALFDTRLTEKFKAGQLPAGVEVVPVLYQGAWKPEIVSTVMEKLKTFGSVIQPGFMRPEGIVIRFERNGALFKQVFEAEETGWKREKPAAIPALTPDEVLPFLQPIRLNKLLVREERFLIQYPETLPAIAAAYVADLEKESPEFLALEGAALKSVKKAVFPWVKALLAEKGYAA